MARKVGLAAEDVVDAAARIADGPGLEAVSLASVAAALGVRSPSLYAHVEGLPGLRRRLALRAAGELRDALSAAAAAEARGEPALRAISRAYRRYAAAHPGLYAAAQRAVGPDEDPGLYAALAEVVGPVLRALAAAGVPEGERVHLARALRSALHGFVALESGGGFGMPDSVEESFDRLLDLLLAGVRAAARPA